MKRKNQKLCCFGVEDVIVWTKGMEQGVVDAVKEIGTEKRVVFNKVATIKELEGELKKILYATVLVNGAVEKT